MLIKAESLNLKWENGAQINEVKQRVSNMLLNYGFVQISL